jgi:hypothetical protein
MNYKTIICCVFAIILGMLVFHMLKNVCGCKVVEGTSDMFCDPSLHEDQFCPSGKSCKEIYKETKTECNYECYKSSPNSTEVDRCDCQELSTPNKPCNFKPKTPPCNDWRTNKVYRCTDLPGVDNPECNNSYQPNLVFPGNTPCKLDNTTGIGNICKEDVFNDCNMKKDINGTDICCPSDTYLKFPHTIKSLDILIDKFPHIIKSLDILIDKFPHLRQISSHLNQ